MIDNDVLICKHCGSVMFYVSRKRVTNKNWYHNGLYCANCAGWAKWANEKTLRKLKVSGNIVYDLMSDKDEEYIKEL